MNAASTLYPPGLTGRRARITGHGNVPGTQEYQGARPGGALRPPISNSKLNGRRGHAPPPEIDLSCGSVCELLDKQAHGEVDPQRADPIIAQVIED